MLYLFLNPNKNINNLILKIIESYKIDFQVFYPKSKNQLSDFYLENNGNITILSVLSNVIFPKDFLEMYKSCYNIHPGTKKYPGFGYNFALLNNEDEYGAVCHIMEERIDTGQIILESNFIIDKNDTVDKLQFKTYLHILAIFNDFIINFTKDKLDNLNKISWDRKPYLKKDFLEMCENISDTKLLEKFMNYPDGEVPMVEKYF